MTCERRSIKPYSVRFFWISVLILVAGFDFVDGLAQWVMCQFSSSEEHDSREQTRPLHAMNGFYLNMWERGGSSSSLGCLAAGLTFFDSEDEDSSPFIQSMSFVGQYHSI